MRRPLLQVLLCSDFRRGLPHMQLQHLHHMEREVLSVLDWHVQPCGDSKYQQYRRALDELLDVQREAIGQICAGYGDVYNDVVSSYGVHAMDFTSI